jgi:pimeloyl-ACP methyl ester carboxylesterase
MAFAVALDGTRLAFEVSGAGEPLLLLSGQGQDRQVWRLAAPVLAQHFQVICMDYRGTGASDKPRELAYSTRGFAADAIAPTPAFARRLHYLASEAHDTWELLPQISAPTLIVHGDADRINPPENARLLAARIPHAHLHWIVGGRHGYVDEHLQEACRVVSTFLQQQAVTP